MKHKGLTTLIACVAVGAVGVPTALGTTQKKPVVKNVQVRDDFYSTDEGDGQAGPAGQLDLEQARTSTRTR